MKKKIVLLVVMLSVAALLVVGCEGSQDTVGQSESEDAANGDAAPNGFKEYPVGDEVQVEGMNIAAVYFQPASMEPKAKAGIPVEEADIHIEADIAALKDNPRGFGFGEFVPYLTVKYKLENLDSGENLEGSFMPMNASDGPHYGANIKMLGAGNYKLTYLISAPTDYLLHADDVTGVPDATWWRKPLEISWDFNFIPRKW